MNGVQTRLKCKPNVKRCKRFVFAAHSPLLHPNTLKTKAIIHFQTDHILTRFVFPPLDAVYETALNGSFLEVKLVAGSVGDDEPRGMQPEYECYHISYPDKKDTILFEQPLDAADDKVTVYDLGKKIKSIEGCCHKTLTKGESRTATARKVVAHGPMWIYVAIAVGMDKAGTESPL